MTPSERAERNEAMAEAYREGATCRDISDDVGLHPGRVWHILHEMGVQMRPAGPPKGTKPQWLHDANKHDRMMDELLFG